MEEKEEAHTPTLETWLITSNRTKVGPNPLQYLFALLHASELWWLASINVLLQLLWCLHVEGDRIAGADEENISVLDGCILSIGHREERGERDRIGFERVVLRRGWISEEVVVNVEENTAPYYTVFGPSWK